MRRIRVHITKHKNGWQAKSEGSSRASSVAPTQKEAIDRGREIARNQKTELVIHGRDGRIRDSDSYGNDPCPPKDKKH